MHAHNVRYFAALYRLNNKRVLLDAKEAKTEKRNGTDRRRKICRQCAVVLTLYYSSLRRTLSVLSHNFMSNVIIISVSWREYDRR